MNMLGRREKYEQAPFFWSQHYEMTINYVGHAEAWDSTDVVGTIKERDGLVRFRKDGRTLAVASISRDRENLAAELELEGSRQRAASQASPELPSFSADQAISTASAAEKVRSQIVFGQPKICIIQQCRVA